MVRLTWVQMIYFMSYFLLSTCVCLLSFVYDSVPVRAGSEVLSQSVATHMSLRKHFLQRGELF